MSKPPKPRRRWFQFSLRTFLILVTLVGGACGWFAMTLAKAERQHKAIAELGADDIFITWDYQEDKYARDVSQPPGPDWLRERLGLDFIATPVSLSCHEWDDRTAAVIVNGLPDLKTLGLHISNAFPMHFPKRSMGPFTVAGLDQLSRLSKLEELSITHYVDDSTMSHFARFSRLKTLTLWNPQITGEGLHSLQLPNLETLNLCDAKLTGPWMKQLQPLRKLRCLGLPGTAVTADNLASLDDLPALSELYIGSNELTEAYVDQLRKLSRLRVLGCRANRQTLPQVARIVQLQELQLAGSDIHDDDLQPLESLVNLEKLTLSDLQVNGEGLRHLQRLEHLKELSLFGIGKHEDVLLVQIARLKQLRTLELAFEPISDAGVAQLAALDKLEQLELDGTQLTDSCVPELAKLKSLKKLDLVRTSLTPAGKEKLCALLPNCKMNFYSPF